MPDRSGTSPRFKIHKDVTIPALIRRPQLQQGPEANYTRYINHSTSPNAFLITSNRWKTARFEAIRPIAPGDEIFFNYGEDYWAAAK